MSEENIFGIGLIVLVISVVFIIARYIYLLRKSMIEYGLEPQKRANKNTVYQTGGILIGLGIGLLIASIFSALDLTEDTADLLAWGTIVVCTGIGLLVAHTIGKRIDK